MNPETQLHLTSILLNPQDAYTAPVRIEPPPVADRCMLFVQELLAEIQTNAGPWNIDSLKYLMALVAKYDVPMPKKGADGIWRITE